MDDMNYKSNGGPPVFRHLTTLIFVDWLPTGQWFAEVPVSLAAGIGPRVRPIERSKMDESCTSAWGIKSGAIIVPLNDLGHPLHETSCLHMPRLHVFVFVFSKYAAEFTSLQT